VPAHGRAWVLQQNVNARCAQHKPMGLRVQYGPKKAQKQYHGHVGHANPRGQGRPATPHMPHATHGDACMHSFTQMHLRCDLNIRKCVGTYAKVLCTVVGGWDCDPVGADRPTETSCSGPLWCPSGHSRRAPPSCPTVPWKSLYSGKTQLNQWGHYTGLSKNKTRNSGYR
jgi:hypothetical protein